MSGCTKSLSHALHPIASRDSESPLPNEKRSLLLIHTHNETFVVAMRSTADSQAKLRRKGPTKGLALMIDR